VLKLNILKDLISGDALPFFERFGSIETVFSNLNSSNYKDWITSEKTAQTKVKLIAAIRDKNTVELERIKKEALEYCAKPWAAAEKENIQKVCECI